MNNSLSQESLQNILSDLSKANLKFKKLYPGEKPDRQPVHVVYGGAQLFKSNTAKKMGELSIKGFEEYAPDASVLSKVFDIKDKKLAEKIYKKVKDKLAKEAVEDFRIDFEDGFGVRPDDEEDRTAETAALETAKGMKEGTLSPFIGIRIKTFSEELKHRAIRTLDIFLTTLLGASGGILPENFVVTLPKVNLEEQVVTLIKVLNLLEEKLKLEKGSLKMEIMIETTQSLFSTDGQSNIINLIKVAEGRCKAAHFGVYDYTAACDITAKYQAMDNPVCDFARHMMKVSLANTGVWLSDGATNIMPVGPNRGELSKEQKDENHRIVHNAWRLAYDHTNHSLKHGFYQGWDLHPAQLPVRYIAVYNFFLEGLNDASVRLKNFIEKAAQATLVGDVFDDAATGQGLLNYFLRALNCGAITEEEVELTGLTIDEIRVRSFMKILELRKERNK